MCVAFFSSHGFDREYFDAANVAHGHDLHYLEARLTLATVPLAAGHPAVCVFVNDQVGSDVISTLVQGGTQLVALRSAGFNHMNLPLARATGITVARVPAYSPYPSPNTRWR